MSSEKKQVGFATHLTAGGIAGAMEAVRTPSNAPLNDIDVGASDVMPPVVLPTSRHNQGTDAALAFG